MTMITIQLNNHNQWTVCVIYSSRAAAAALGLAARADSTNESLPVHPSFKQIPGFHQRFNSRAADGSGVEPALLPVERLIIEVGAVGIFGDA